jgi:hypothetical protein
LALASILLVGCAEPSSGPAPRPGPGAEALASKPAPTTIPVTTTVYDAGASGTPLLTRSDDYSGNGFATYTSVSNMTSQIGTSGAWNMYIGNQTARTLYLVLASQGIPAPDGYYWQNVEVYSQCFDQGDTAVGLLAMTSGASNGNCSFGMDFTSARTKYKLVMGPTAPGTGRATVTCTAAVNGSCTTWTIAPNPDAANAGVANLYTFAHNGSLVFYGVYRNSYAVAVAR